MEQKTVAVMLSSGLPGSPCSAGDQAAGPECHLKKGTRSGCSDSTGLSLEDQSGQGPKYDMN